MENETRNFLNDKNIEFIEQYKNKNILGRQSLDFYIPSLNIAIECQGGQHFTSIEHFGGDKGFDYRQKLDKRKYDNCKKHGIKLLYYSNLIEYDNFLGEKLYHNLDELWNNEIEYSFPI